MFEWLLQNGLEVLGLGGYAVVGFLAVFGYFKKDDGRRKESDDLADTLIERLQQTVNQQTKDLAKMQVDMEHHTKDRDEQIRKLSDDLKHMQGRNSILEDLFKGRDPGMQDFLKNAPELLSTTRETSVGLQNLEATLRHFVDTLQPLLIHLEIKKGAVHAV